MSSATVLFLDLDASLHRHDLAFEQPSAVNTRLSVVRNALKCFLAAHVFHSRQAGGARGNAFYAVYGILEKEVCELMPLSAIVDANTGMNAAQLALDQYLPHRASFANNGAENPIPWGAVVGCLGDVRRHQVRMLPQLYHQDHLVGKTLNRPAAKAEAEGVITRGIMFLSRPPPGRAPVSPKTSAPVSDQSAGPVFLDVLALGADPSAAEGCTVALKGLCRGGTALQSFSVTQCPTAASVGSSLIPLLSDHHHLRRFSNGLLGSQKVRRLSDATSPTPNHFLLTVPKLKSVVLTAPPSSSPPQATLAAPAPGQHAEPPSASLGAGGQERRPGMEEIFGRQASEPPLGDASLCRRIVHSVVDDFQEPKPLPAPDGTAVPSPPAAVDSKCAAMGPAQAAQPASAGSPYPAAVARTDAPLNTLTGAERADARRRFEDFVRERFVGGLDLIDSLFQSSLTEEAMRATLVEKYAKAGAGRPASAPNAQPTAFLPPPPAPGPAVLPRETQPPAVAVATTTLGESQQQQDAAVGERELHAKSDHEPEPREVRAEPPARPEAPQNLGVRSGETSDAAVTAVPSPPTAAHVDPESELVSQPGVRRHRSQLGGVTVTSAADIDALPSPTAATAEGSAPASPSAASAVPAWGPPDDARHDPYSDFFNYGKS